MESCGDLQGTSLLAPKSLQLVFLLQITVNYLQVTAIAICVNVNWTETLFVVFETAGD